MEIRELKISDNEYPPLLKEIQNPPERIFIRGNLPRFSLPWIAIVGTRKATHDGIELAKKVAKALAEKGFIIVSGLAMGIDTAAHNGALAGKGITLAVLANGIDTIYPAQNQNLANKILEYGGAILSEYEPGTSAMPYRFLERNRIVAGLCVATIVIEAPKKSGAIVTARLAAESGREIFVFPGLAGNPQYAGSHALIRDGARLVNSIDDILEDLSFNTTNVMQRSETININESKLPLNIFAEEKKLKNHFQNENLSMIPKKIYDILSKSQEPLTLDKIAEYTKLSAQEVNQIIGELIIYGIVLETPIGYKLKN
ncbi:MAG: DNA-processing protein DprA [bacterium]|nr:DNA-processing protein DprA [bacterium]